MCLFLTGSGSSLWIAFERLVWGIENQNNSRHGRLSKKSKLEDTHKVNVLLDNGRKQFSSLTGKMEGIKEKWTILSSTVLIWFWPWILVVAGVRGETQTFVFLFLDLTFWGKKRTNPHGLSYGGTVWVISSKIRHLAFCDSKVWPLLLGPLFLMKPCTSPLDKGPTIFGSYWMQGFVRCFWGSLCFFGSHGKKQRSTVRHLTACGQYLSCHMHLTPTVLISWSVCFSVFKFYSCFFFGVKPSMQ